MPHPRFAAALLVVMSSSAVAADMLPLKQGIYVPVGRACKGASNADMINYWGGKSSIGSSGGTCTIKKMTKVGNRYTLDDVCKDLGGETVGGGPTVVQIMSPTLFKLSGTMMRYCGPKVQF